MMNMTIRAAVVLAAAWLAGCGQAVAGCGIASPYTPGNGADVSAAHPTLPPGTRVIVRNQQTGRSIVVRIADRSPFLLGRIIDLSADAMSALGMGARAPVCVEVVSFGSASRGFGKLKPRDPMAEQKRAAVRQVKTPGKAALSARVRSAAKTARVPASKAKRIAQIRRAKQLAKKSSRQRVASRG